MKALEREIKRGRNRYHAGFLPLEFIVAAHPTG